MNSSLSFICQALDEANAWGRLEESDFSDLLKRLERGQTVYESIKIYNYIVNKVKQTGLEMRICTEANITEMGWGAPEVVFNLLEVEKFNPVGDIFNHTMLMLTKYERCDVRSHQKSMVTEMFTRVPFPCKADIIDYLSETLSTSIKRLCIPTRHLFCNKCYQSKESARKAEALGATQAIQLLQPPDSGLLLVKLEDGNSSGQHFPLQVELEKKVKIAFKNDKEEDFQVVNILCFKKKCHFVNYIISCPSSDGHTVTRIDDDKVTRVGSNTSVLDISNSEVPYMVLLKRVTADESKTSVEVKVVREDAATKFSVSSVQEIQVAQRIHSRSLFADLKAKIKATDYDW